MVHARQNRAAPHTSSKPPESPLVRRAFFFAQGSVLSVLARAKSIAEQRRTSLESASSYQSRCVPMPNLSFGERVARTAWCAEVTRCIFGMVSWHARSSPSGQLEFSTTQSFIGQCSSRSRPTHSVRSSGSSTSARQPLQSTSLTGVELRILACDSPIKMGTPVGCILFRKVRGRPLRS
jgi:hypothetical protein